MYWLCRGTHIRATVRAVAYGHVDFLATISATSLAGSGLRHDMDVLVAYEEEFLRSCSVGRRLVMYRSIKDAQAQVMGGEVCYRLSWVGRGPQIDTGISD
jgi:hypothetical protein